MELLTLMGATSRQEYGSVRRPCHQFPVEEPDCFDCCGRAAGLTISRAQKRRSGRLIEIMRFVIGVLGKTISTGPLFQEISIC